jgi:hypothetical protein
MIEGVIDRYLQGIKSKGKASPDGRYWHDFFLYLQDHKITGGEDPPVPLILAASWVSPKRKHDRLRQQLIWAMNNDILDQAIDYLNQLPDENWIISSKDRWDIDNRIREDLE